MLSKNRAADVLKCPPNAQKNEYAKNALRNFNQTSFFAEAGRPGYLLKNASKKLHKFFTVWIGMQGIA